MARYFAGTTHGVRICIKLKGAKLGEAISVQVYTDECLDHAKRLVEAIGLGNVAWVDMYRMPSENEADGVWQYDSYEAEVG